jgi:cell division protein FtsB
MRRRKSDQLSWRNVFYSGWFLILNIILLILVAYAAGRSLLYHYSLQKEIKQFEEHARMLESEKNKTIELLNYVDSEDFLDRKARLELNLLKSGEHMVYLSSTTKVSLGGQNNDGVIEQKKLSNPQRWWMYFFHN